MDFGAHLPLMDFGGNPYTFEHLAAYTETAARLGFSALSVNDHMVFSVPWLDGPTALAAMIGHSGAMTLVDNGVAAGHPRTGAAGQDAGRHRPTQPRTAGRRRRSRLVRAGLQLPSASTSPSDGRASTRRSARSRALWRADATPFVGRFYSTEGIRLDPHPTHQEGPPIWVGSWGSEAGLRRTARLADGWLASAYNTTPTEFGEAWAPTAGPAPRPRQGPRGLPQRARDHVVLHHGQPGRSRPSHAGTDGADHPPPGGDPPRPSARRSGTSGSLRSSPPSRGPGSSGSSCGPSPTRRTNSSCSGRTYGRRWPPRASSSRNSTGRTWSYQGSARVGAPVARLSMV